MRYSGFVHTISLLLLIACHHHRKGDPVNTSYAFREGQISLGGIVAERSAEPDLIDSARYDRPSALSEKIINLEQWAEGIKKTGERVLPKLFYDDWREIQKEVIISFNDLSRKDIAAWAALNDSLLKYSGAPGFAEELEKMVYNAPVPEVITGKMVKSFCYTRLYDRIYVNILGSSEVEYEHTTGGRVRILQDTRYPIDGRIILKVELQESRYLDLFIRIPQWSKHSSVEVKGVRYNTVAGDYTEVARKWKDGDQAEVILGLGPEVIREKQGSVGFSYGPLILSYLPPDQNENFFRGTDPIQYLQLVSPAGEMPTFTFSGIPGKTLVLQPFLSQRQDPADRTVWIKTTSK